VAESTEGIVAPAGGKGLLGVFFALPEGDAYELVGQAADSIFDVGQTEPVSVSGRWV
jgi:hypothetical protein